MQWPVSPEVHPDSDFLHDLQATIADIASTIAEFEPVVLLAAAEHHKAIRKLVSGQVELWDIPTDDLWARDSGPSFVVDGKGGLALTQFNFKAGVASRCMEMTAWLPRGWRNVWESRSLM
jgi:agmatine deiminase